VIAIRTLSKKFAGPEVFAAGRCVATQRDGRAGHQVSLAWVAVSSAIESRTQPVVPASGAVCGVAAVP
jgi:hypothetical protein